MQALVYYLVLPFIYLVSLLPFGALYAVSDFMYVVLYKLLGYRKGVVLTNLRKSFPEKSEKEIEQIASNYYKYLCDLFLETFKTLTVSRKTMLKHCYFSPQALKVFDDLAAENKSVVLVMGHFGNWEWAGNTFSMQCKHQLYVIYHPIRNKYFDWLMYRMRTRFGTKLIAMKDTFREMLANREELNATAFIADQTPAPENAYWTEFLNQDTPVFKGTELIARKVNYTIVYAKVKRVKRGYYEIFAEVLHDNPKSTTDGEISELHTKKLEQDIIEQPEIWLWSHRRWKHKRPTPVKEKAIA
ncbi:lysophospholipid acyltransferase family protein [Polluticoccus soli]|uniref:lysophospholipid acyltransferase family protein n=1 Tax=Polluticoccus soli TaxID=3034150 RepID=UPI0023E15882|nr:lysophospholipid acyltransferase family protein [Flavipsychrobacter sp. JY13-12]